MNRRSYANELTHWLQVLAGKLTACLALLTRSAMVFKLSNRYCCCGPQRTRVYSNVSLTLERGERCISATSLGLPDIEILYLSGR